MLDELIDLPPEVAEDLQAEVADAPFEVLEESAQAEACEETEDVSEEHQGTDARAEHEEVLQLRAEVERLRAEAQSLAEGYAELVDLYPSAQLSNMPDSFTEAVKNGVPPAAAYALEMRRREVRAKRAEAARRAAADTSAGKISTVDDGLFTPDEVRGMTRREVRENYGRIMESMRHWK